MATTTAPTPDVVDTAAEPAEGSLQEAINLPASTQLSPFVLTLIRGGDRKMRKLLDKPLSAWPAESLEAAVSDASEQLTKFDNPDLTPIGTSSRESSFLRGQDRNVVALDLRLLSFALEARGTAPAPAAAPEQSDLFAPAPDVAAGTTEEEQHLLLAEIERDPNQPRTRDNVDEDLAPSIALQGVLQAITVRPHPDPAAASRGVKWMIIDGERRVTGARKAGRTTILAKIQPAEETRAQRLLRQTASNTGKPLTPLEQARAWQDILDETKWSAAQLAKIVGVAKSTMSDALAMAKAPAPFVPLFENGILTPAAAPIARRLAQVPTKILEKALREAQQDWQWRDHIDGGHAVPLDDVEHVLNDAVMQELERVPDDVKDYPGETVLIAGGTYALEPKQLATYVAEYQKAHPPAKAKKTATPRAEPSAGEKKFREQQQREREQRERVKQAIPAVTEAFAAAVRKASSAVVTGVLLDYIVLRLGGEYTPASGRKQINTLVPRGAIALDNLRHLAMWALQDDLTNEYRLERQLAGLAKQLGIDLKAIVEKAAPAPAPKPAEKKPVAKKGAKPAAKKASQAKKAKK